MRESICLFSATSFLLAGLSLSSAASVNWTGSDPNSSQWSFADNWSAVPQTGDDLVFGTTNNRTTNVDDVQLSLASLSFADSAPAFAIHIEQTLTITGTGITSFSANVVQSLVVDNGNQTIAPGFLNITNSAVVGVDEDVNGVLQITNTGATGANPLSGNIVFQGSAGAGKVTIDNLGNVDNVSAAPATVHFLGTATAGDSMITNEGGTVSNNASPFLPPGGATIFSENSTAGQAAIINNLSPGQRTPGSTTFQDDASADEAVITNNPGTTTQFTGSSTAHIATIHNLGGNGGPGGQLIFMESAQGGGSQIILDAAQDGVSANGGLMDISQLTTGGITVGTIEGGGNIFLGSKTLTLIGVGEAKTFSGVIADGGTGGGTGGSVNMAGNEDSSLTLSGTNTYTGGTTVSGGRLLVDGSIVGNTEVQSGGTLGGSGTVGNGGVSVVTIASGGTLSPGNSPGTLHINGTLDFKTGSTYLVQLNIASPGGGGGAQSDQTQVTGDVLLNNSTLSLQLDLTPVVGQQFTIIDNQGIRLIIGIFSGLAQGSQFTSGGDTFSISYTGGDGNDVVLTTVAVPEPTSLTLIGFGILLFLRRRSK